MKHQIKNVVRKAAWAAALMASSVLPASAATVNVNADINTSTTWTSNNEYVLQNIIYVTSGATLTIEPGTVVRGEPVSAPGVFDPGTLIVSRGSKIVANGTPTKPIIFTDMVDNQVPGGAKTDVWTPKKGQWGGIIVLGSTYIAVNTSGGPNPARENQVEGLLPGFVGDTRGIYGGSNDDDDSGSLSYVSLRYGGEVLSLNNEINGFTFGAVGRSTVIHHIESLNNLDDAIEFFGGTVNMKYVITWAQGDDGLDSDEGYRGKTQFALVVQGDCGGTIQSGLSDKGSEIDGGLNPDESQPYGLFTRYNTTFVGMGGEASDVYSTKAKNTALHFRDNAAGRYYNSVFTSFGGAGVIVENEPGHAALAAPWIVATSAQRQLTDWTAYCPGPFPLGLTGADFYTGHSTLSDDGTPSMQLELKDNVWYQSPAGWPNISPTANADVLAAGGANVPGTGNLEFAAPHRNVVALKQPVTTLTRGVSSFGAGHPGPITVLDPRPALDSAALLTTATAPNDGFYSPVSYKGAFNGAENWTQGWSLVNAFGIIPTVPSLTLFTDNYNRHNGSSVTPEYNVAVGSLSITGNKLESDTTPGAVTLADISGVSASDVSIEADVTVGNVGTQASGPVARYNSATTSLYWGALISDSGSTFAGIFKLQSGSLTALSFAPVGSNSGKIRFDVVGDSLKIHFNGVLVASAMDSSLTGTKAGLLSLNGSYDNLAVTSATVGLPFQDEFNRPATTSIGAQLVEPLGDFSIAGSKLVGVAGQANLAYLNGLMAQDMSVQADVDTGVAGTDYSGVFARFDPVGGTFYWGVLQNDSGVYTGSIWKFAGGSLTQLVTAPAASGKGRLSFKLSGGALELYLDNTLVVSTVDPTPVPGLAGVLSLGGSFDNFLVR